MTAPPDPSGDDARLASDRGSNSAAPPGVPRWVKVSAIIVGVLILLVVIVKLAGLGGEHGPGRHTGSLPSVSVPAARTPPGGTA